MYILAANMWFQTLMRQFFFNIDKIVFNFIPTIYDLLISIARTSILSQADILNMADRVYKLLAVFMVFKVTFSLIMYVVNPDDFSDKSKGVSKLVSNIVISLALLILTPYIFNYAYKLQTIVLEDNSLFTVIFGDDNNTSSNAFLTAGDSMAFTSISPFFTPNLGINELSACTTLLDGNNEFNGACSDTLNGFVKKGTLSQTTKENYVAGVENQSLGLMFRQDIATATDESKQNFIIDYKYVFSTVVGVIIVLLLITFCMDIALRSIKLAFLQLIAPIPIISYIDPKSGKDGMFKKWYQMCFKTYLSLFVRLLALYFAVYIISRIDRMSDIIDGSYVSNLYIKIFVIIGALMFAKQFPKILEGLGIKLDDGKLFLNPLRKVENQALGGQMLKKPNDALAKFGKGIALAPLSTASLLGKKTIGGIDAAKHGKGFKQGWSRTHGKLYNGFNKKLDEWAPERAEERKADAQARANLHFMQQKEARGADIYKRAYQAAPVKADGTRDASKGLERLFSSSAYLESYQRVNKAKGEMYAAQAKKQADTAAVEDELSRKQALYQQQLNNNKINEETFKELNSKAIEAAQNRIKAINKDAGTAEKRYEIAKGRHDEMKKMSAYRGDALLEDSFDYYDKTASSDEKDKLTKDYATNVNNPTESSTEENQSQSNANSREDYKEAYEIALSELRAIVNAHPSDDVRSEAARKFSSLRGAWESNDLNQISSAINDARSFLNGLE